MEFFRNEKGATILLAMVKAIQDNKAYLSEVDGLIGDGDHGMNMNKGFSLFEDRFGAGNFTFSEGLENLGTILMNEIGGSMGPIYGTIFMEMAAAVETNQTDTVDLLCLSRSFAAALEGLYEIIDARVGDKTLVDTLAPAASSLEKDAAESLPFSAALQNMRQAATAGMEATKAMTAKYGRSSRLGERSRGVLDAGACSCCLIICALADSITLLLEEVPQ